MIYINAIATTLVCIFYFAMDFDLEATTLYFVVFLALDKIWEGIKNERD